MHSSKPEHADLQQAELRHLIVFDRLRERLLHAGIAPRHVRRTLAELRDHYDDAVRDEQSKGLDAVAAAQTAWTRLGDEDHLARSILARLELRSLPARYPRAVFGAGPVVLWVAAIVVTMLGLALLVQTLRAASMLRPPGSPDPLWLFGPAYAACFFYARILPLVVGLAMMATAIRQRLPLRWPVIGAALISIVGGTTDITVTFVTKIGEHAELYIGNPLLAPLSDTFVSPAMADLGHGMGIAAVNFVIILAPYLIWLKRSQLKMAK